MRRALLILLELAACGGPQLAAPSKANLTKSLPATLEATHPKSGDPRPVHVRVWADTGVRALPRWKDEITDQLDYAGQLLTPMLGIRLTVDSIKDWDHAGTDPRSALAALAKTDDAKDVHVGDRLRHCRLGDVASTAMTELGASEVLGHYVTVRSWAEKPETEKLAAKLPDLDPAQRAETLAAHKRHKQVVVLLHMLAQTLGAIGEADPAWIQHPAYSSKQHTFSDRDRELMQLAIDARLGAGTDQTIAHDLIEAIEKNQWGGWVPTDHDEVVKFLRNVVDSAKAGKTAADVPAAVYEQFDRVRELLKRGELDEAHIELDNILASPERISRQRVDARAEVRDHAREADRGSCTDRQASQGCRRRSQPTRLRPRFQPSRRHPTRPRGQPVHMRPSSHPAIRRRTSRSARRSCGSTTSSGRARSSRRPARRSRISRRARRKHGSDSSGSIRRWAR